MENLTLLVEQSRGGDREALIAPAIKLELVRWIVCFANAGRQPFFRNIRTWAEQAAMESRCTFFAATIHFYINTIFFSFSAEVLRSYEKRIGKIIASPQTKERSPHAEEQKDIS